MLTGSKHISGSLQQPGEAEPAELVVTSDAETSPQQLQRGFVQVLLRFSIFIAGMPQH